MTMANQRCGYVNIEFPVNLLFGYPMVIYNSTDGTILNCGIFKEDTLEDGGEIDTKGTSGATLTSPLVLLRLLFLGSPQLFWLLLPHFRLG